MAWHRPISLLRSTPPSESCLLNPEFPTGEAMSYFTRTQIEAELPSPDLVALLDDDHDGAEDTGLHTALAARAEARCDAILGRRYTVPFADGSVPGPVEEAAILSLCASLYRRRGTKDDDNPFAEREKTALDFLHAAAAGTADLSIDLDATGAIGTIEGQDNDPEDDLHFALANQNGL
jgi:phage gp36-like protein